MKKLVIILLVFFGIGISAYSQHEHHQPSKKEPPKTVQKKAPAKKATRKKATVKKPDQTEMAKDSVAGQQKDTIPTGHDHQMTMDTVPKNNSMQVYSKKWTRTKH